jgi:hypothetical protein
MKWFWQRPRQPTDENDKTDLDQARRMRILAEKRLREARTAAQEVKDVAIEAYRIRNENRFSQRLNEVFGSRPQQNG